MAQMKELATILGADPAEPRGLWETLVAKRDEYRAEAVRLRGDRTENETWQDEADDQEADALTEAADFLDAVLAMYFDASTGAARQQYIDTGSYPENGALV